MLEVVDLKAPLCSAMAFYGILAEKPQSGLSPQCIKLCGAWDADNSGLFKLNSTKTETLDQCAIAGVLSIEA